jgi:predicted Zn-dependent peptidase
VVRPLLREEDISREREIIVEEIRSYRDDPGQFVYNVFDEGYFGDTPLGWEIAGTEDTVRGLSAEDIRAFWGAGYKPANLVVAAAGDLSHERVVELVRKSFGSGTGVVPEYGPAPATLPATRITVHNSPIAQAHLCLGLPALPRDHPDQWSLELLNTVLGDGSSSRLFQRVREEKGLAYDVHSFQTDYADCGTLQIYAGVDPSALASAIEAILAELARLRDEVVPQAELEKARNYASGRLELRLEESRAMASWLGGQEALHDRVLTPDEALAALDAVTPGDIHALAGRLIRDEGLALSVIAPARHGKKLEKSLRLP